LPSRAASRLANGVAPDPVPRALALGSVAGLTGNQPIFGASAHASARSRVANQWHGYRMRSTPEPNGKTRREIMCERTGTAWLSSLRSMDFGRRGFLRATAASTLTLAVGHAAQAADSHIKSIHGSGFCNLNYFLANALQTAQEDGLIIDFVMTPTNAEMVTFLGAGQVDAGLIPYTSFIALHDAGAPVTIVAGGGIEGVVLIAQPGLDTSDKLKGKTLGTFQMDTLEVMPYDWLKKNNVNFKDITVRYMGNTPEAVEAFKAGALDMVCTVEPYASALLHDVKGSVMLSDGTDIYGHGYTDCVLAVRNDLIKQNPAGIKALIKGMMKAQYMAETKPDEVLKIVVGPYYKTSMENAKIGMARQPSVVDARSQTQFILDRTASLLEMGYIKQKPGRDAIDWALLEAVISENPDLYGKLKYKSA
jgi:NitT/TauT family transport system substrate-binding protein